MFYVAARVFSIVLLFCPLVVAMWFLRYREWFHAMQFCIVARVF